MSVKSSLAWFSFSFSILLLGPQIVCAQPIQQDVFFHTPSNNIWCNYQMDQSRLRCDVDQRKWKDWGCKPYGCFGTGFILPNIGKAQPKQVSDSLIGSSNSVLQYGKSISLGSIQCLSEATGLTCKNKSGGMLHLNREFYIVN